MKEITDQHILELLRKRKTLNEGFRLLMTKYQERLYWQIRRYVKSHEDADDVLQNTFVKVHRNIGKFEGRSGLYTWLFRIATNEALSHVRKHRLTVVELNNDSTLAASGDLGETMSPGPETIEETLREAIRTLPEKQHEVFTMRYFGEMSYEEISKEVGTSVGSLKASYHHAVKKITKYVKSNVI